MKKYLVIGNPIGHSSSPLIHNYWMKKYNLIDSVYEKKKVEEEDLEHQFFYTPGGGLSVTTTYSNFDADGNPLGTQFTLTAGAASSGTLTFTLRHEPTKPNSGLSDAGGETDISATFDVTVQ